METAARYMRATTGMRAERPVRRATVSEQLTLRQRATLDLLLHGYSRQQIADRLGISVHTASGYVKEVFRHFGVHTHAELIAGFYRNKFK